jgi:cell division protein FtsL
MATRRVTRRGRSWIALGLLVFVVVATAVVWRRMYGIARGTEIDRLERTVSDLEARRAALQSRIREASSLDRIGPIARERLKLHVPDDTMVIHLPRGPVPRPSRDDPR